MEPPLLTLIWMVLGWAIWMSFDDMGGMGDMNEIVHMDWSSGGRYGWQISAMWYSFWNDGVDLEMVGGYYIPFVNYSLVWSKQLYSKQENDILLKLIKENIDVQTQPLFMKKMTQIIKNNYIPVSILPSLSRLRVSVWSNLCLNW